MAGIKGKYRVKATGLAMWLAGTMLTALPAQALTLKEALTAAYNDNPSLKAERQNLQILNQRVAQAMSGWRPSVTASLEKGRQRTQSTGTNWSYGDTQTVQLLVSQSLYNGGGTIAAVDAAETRVKAGQHSLNAEEQNLMLQTVATYLNLVRDNLLFDLSTNNERVLQEQLRATNERFDVGEVTRTDVSQAKARVAQALSERIQAEGTLNSTRATFTRLTGLKPETLEVPEAALLPKLPESLDAAIAIALAQNFDYLMAKQRVEAAGYDIAVNESALLPKVTLQGAVQRQQGAGINGSLDFDNDSLMLNVEVPLYQSGRQYALTREANEEKLRLEQALAEAKNQLVENVTRVWERLLTARATIESTNSAVKAAEVALDGVKQEQLYGARTTLDVLDAEQELFAVNVALVRAKNDEMVARYNLLALMGDLTARKLDLEVAYYEPSEQYEKTRNRWIGTK